MKSKHSVLYVGGGVWKDSKGELWRNNQVRDYETEMTQEEFLDDRKDIEFMKTYGQMHITTVSVEEQVVIEGTGVVTDTNSKPVEVKQAGTSPIVIGATNTIIK